MKPDLYWWMFSQPVKYNEPVLVEALQRQHGNLNLPGCLCCCAPAELLALVVLLFSSVCLHSAATAAARKTEGQLWCVSSIQLPTLSNL